MIRHTVTKNLTTFSLPNGIIKTFLSPKKFYNRDFVNKPCNFFGETFHRWLSTCKIHGIFPPCKFHCYLHTLVISLPTLPWLALCPSTPAHCLHIREFSSPGHSGVWMIVNIVVRTDCKGNLLCINKLCTPTRWFTPVLLWAKVLTHFSMYVSYVLASATTNVLVKSI